MLQDRVHGVPVAICGRKSAVESFQAIQEELAPLEGQHSDRAKKLARDQWLLAWRFQTELSWPEAKEMQLEAADGRPLTACFGHSWQAFDPGLVKAMKALGRAVPDGVVRKGGDGCGLIYPDAPSTRGPRPFRIYCPTCSDRSTWRKRSATTRANAFSRGLEEIVVGDAPDGTEVLGWSGVCVRCERPFVNARPDTRRCDRCR